MTGRALTKGFPANRPGPACFRPPRSRVLLSSTFLCQWLLTLLLPCSSRQECETCSNDYVTCRKVTRHWLGTDILAHLLARESVDRKRAAAAAQELQCSCPTVPVPPICHLPAVPFGPPPGWQGILHALQGPPCRHLHRHPHPHLHDCQLFGTQPSFASPRPQIRSLHYMVMPDWRKSSACVQHKHAATMCPGGSACMPHACCLPPCPLAAAQASRLTAHVKPAGRMASAQSVSCRAASAN